MFCLAEAYRVYTVRMTNIIPPLRPVSQTAVQARANYDRLSRWYDWLAASEARYREAGLACLAAQPGEAVLEIGFGTGQNVLALATAVGHSGQVCGLDVSPGMLAVAKNRLAQAGAGERVDLRLGDAVDLPYDTAVFDAVFMSFTLELFAEADMPLVLAEIRRVLRTNGRLGVVSLAQEGGGTAVRLYEWCHAHWPAVIDCRPIRLLDVLQTARFCPVQVKRMSMWGLPVEIVVATTSAATTSAAAT